MVGAGLCLDPPTAHGSCRCCSVCCTCGSSRRTGCPRPSFRPASLRATQVHVSGVVATGRQQHHAVGLRATERLAHRLEMQAAAGGVAMRQGCTVAPPASKIERCFAPIAQLGSPTHTPRCANQRWMKPPPTFRPADVPTDGTVATRALRMAACSAPNSRCCTALHNLRRTFDRQIGLRVAGFADPRFATAARCTLRNSGARCVQRNLNTAVSKRSPCTLAHRAA
jgi:hypothetical protein